MWIRVFITFLCSVISFTGLFTWGGAAALANADVTALIQNGAYAEAVVRAEAMQSAEGYALAAESLNAQILLGEVDDINDEAKRARKLASRALDIEPESFNARLQYALADGFVTRTTGTLKAWRKKLPTRTLAIATAFYDDYPNDARASALLGAWHLGVVRKAGDKNGNKWFGASSAEGRRLYDVASAMAPDDILIAVNYAAALLVLDEALYAADVTARLQAVSKMTARNDVERKVQARAAAILAQMDDLDEAEDLAEDFLDGKWR